MRIGCRPVLIVLVFLTLPAALLACLWDYDTLMMERQRFPSTLELITGKFLRHSPEFYQWRIRDRTAKLKTHPDILGYYDDLAVAYNKVGEHQKAIDTILIKEKQKPGLYETYANLGTFLFYTGEMEKSLEYIDKALAINPNAHFGREKYQKYLTEYVLTRYNEGKLQLPLRRNKDASAKTFAGFLQMTLHPETKEWNAEALSPEEDQAAVRGVLGMMKFADHTSPILLEALGDLLRGTVNPSDDAKRLAARAYLKASYEANDHDAKNAYHKLAEEAIAGQVMGVGVNIDVTLSSIESQLQSELNEADAWFAEVRANELAWIRDGKNPEEEYSLVYYKDPVVSTTLIDWLHTRIGFWGTIILGLCGFTVARILWKIKKRRALAATLRP